MDDAAGLEGIVLESSFLIPRSAVMVLLLLLMCTAASSGQKTSEPSDSAVTFSVRATPVFGFEGAENHSTGTLSIQDRVLRFQRGSKPAMGSNLRATHNLARNVVKTIK